MCANSPEKPDGQIEGIIDLKATFSALGQDLSLVSSQHKVLSCFLPWKCSLQEEKKGWRRWVLNQSISSSGAKDCKP